MRIVPNSTINLYSNIKVRRGMGPVFSSAQKRNTYFQQHLVRQNVPTTYVRHTGEIKVEVPLSVVKNCNYISFINPDFENMTWYALLTNWEYVNNECTSIDYVIDPFMTYMFTFQMHDGMISRQHLSVADYNKAETNPYDPTIYQFTTSEDLVVGPEVEKPEYSIQRFGGDLGSDGKYMLSSSIMSGNAYAYDMGEHVMGVIFMAPLSLDKLDEGATDAWSISPDGEAFSTAIDQEIHTLFVQDGEAVQTQTGTAYRANYSQWNTISTDLISWLSSTQTTYNTPQNVIDAITAALPEASPEDTPGSYIFEAGGVEAVHAAMLSVADAPSQQWLKLMQDIIDGGGSIFNSNDPYLSTHQAGIGKLPWSSFVRAYNIIAIPQMFAQTGLTLFNKVIEKLTTWDAVSQIIGVYAINDNVFNTAFVNGNGIVPSPSDIATGNIYTLPTSFQRVGQGQTAVDSKKLLTFPFSYLRVTTPDGNDKEYRYEWFKEVTSGTGGCKFRVMGDLNSHPSIMMAPIKYRKYSPGYIESSQDMTDAINVNLDEMVTYDEFAQVPFMTDAYLTYLAGQVMRIQGQNTADFRDQLTGRTIKGFGSFMGNLAGDLGQDFDQEAHTVWTKGGTYRTQGWSAAQAANTKTGINIGTGAVQAAGNLWDASTSVNSAKSQITEAQQYLSGEVGGDIDWGRYNSTKPAHANDVYHPGTNGGIYHYLKGLAVTDFIVTYVQLRPSVLQKYDTYFKLYGYNEAGRSDIPYIYNFIHGESQDALVPHWDQDSDGDYVTYLQTMDAHVTGIPLPYANYIEMLFNSGYRFINGDRLIS